jgi:hypothetical protein
VTPETIDTIIAAVGIEPHDRRRLGVLLEQLRGIIRFRRETKTYNLISIRKAIEGVARMVESNIDARSLEPGIAAALDEARRLETDGRRLSLMDQIRGQALAELFIVQFGIRPTAAPHGRYVKFAVAALKAIGEEGTPGTVVRSLTAVRRVRHRVSLAGVMITTKNYTLPT